MPDAFDEVEEALREERALTMWNRTRPYLIGAVLLIVGGVGAWEAYKWQRTRTVETAALQYQSALDALDKQDVPKAKATLEALRLKDGGFSALAGHMEAQVELSSANDPAAAATALLSVAERRKDIQGDIARLKAAYLRADTLELAALEAQVKPLIDKGGTLGALGRELVAAKKFATGDAAGARTLYTELAFDIDAPRGLQTRAQQMLTVIPETPAAAPASPTASAGASAPAPTAPTAPAATPSAPPATPAPSKP